MVPSANLTLPNLDCFPFQSFPQSEIESRIISISRSSRWNGSELKTYWDLESGVWMWAHNNNNNNNNKQLQLKQVSQLYLQLEGNEKLQVML